MSAFAVERIYDLLPAVHRLRDHEQGEVLRALLGVLAREVGVVEQDIARLYENWFIETADEWIVPYIGDLLGVRGLHGVSAATRSRRAVVANTLRYRRRKGTATMLEQLALDVTGWPARVVEFFELLRTSQHMNHIRQHNRSTIDLRDMDGLELVHGPFERAAHSADVRRIAARRPHLPGTYNIPNIGVFLWRLQPYPVTQGIARRVADGRFTFHPVKLDAPLFNAPRTETDITQLAAEADVPAPLRRRALSDDLHRMRQAIVDGDPIASRYFAAPVFSVFLDEDPDPVPSERITICHLRDWPVPPATLLYHKHDGSSVAMPIDLAVDPVLGRIRLGSGVTAGQVRVSYRYGFSGDYGGGPYDRQASVDQWYDPGRRAVTWQIGVSKDPSVPPDPPQIVATLAEAVTAWNAHAATHPDAFGVIGLMDSRTYGESVNPIEIPEHCRLAIVAAGWPLEPTADGLALERVVGHFVPAALRPHVAANLEVEGTAPAASLEGGELILDGLLIEGKLTVRKGNLARLRVAHSTLVPSANGLECAGENAALEIALVHSIAGPVTLPDTVRSVTLLDSLVDGAVGAAITAPGAAVELERCTVLGSTAVLTITASESIFTAPVVAERRQTGCVRFSFVEQPGSVVPSRYRCQADLEIATRIAAAERERSGALTAAERTAIGDRVRQWLAPLFTSLSYGHPGYGQLDLACPQQIRAGAADGAEMGVFHDLRQAQREANLRASLDEYLRAGLEAGLFYVT
jgi:hypothetical protein